MHKMLVIKQLVRYMRFSALFVALARRSVERLSHSHVHNNNNNNNNNDTYIAQIRRCSR